MSCLKIYEYPDHVKAFLSDFVIRYTEILSNRHIHGHTGKAHRHAKILYEYNYKNPREKKKILVMSHHSQGRITNNKLIITVILKV